MFLAVSGETSMTEAIANTCMGMGTVFVILIFIAAIISLFSFIPKIQAKLERKKAPKAADIKPVVKEVKKTAPVAKENLMNDAELVAVITAAIYASSASTGATSKDQLIVRSIRRA